ncbi:hypothetical protein AA15973_1069 [Komagataeibacter sucrofermentans DSM 15973]|nr:hypothetical protein AA15973_1069 [Komagataeibacter sucrofermentans DSM 15973]
MRATVKTTATGTTKTRTTAMAARPTAKSATAWATVKTTATGTTKTRTAAVAARPTAKSATAGATGATGAMLGMCDGWACYGRQRKRHRNKGHGP